MEELNFDNIVEDTEQLDYNNPFATEDVETDENDVDVELQENEQENTENIDPDTLFGGDDDSESVGKENNQEIENSTPSSGGNSSADFYSSIANALKNDGVLEYLDDDMLNNITDAESFKVAIEDEITNRFTGAQRDLYRAMNAGADLSVVGQLNETLNQLNSITEADLQNDNDEASEDLRKRLIYNECIAQGMTQERATREVDKSLAAGTDVDDAIYALNSLKSVYQKQYNSVIQDAELRAKQEQQRYVNMMTQIQDNIMNTEEPFAGLRLDKRTRTKILEDVYVPAITDREGNMYSKLQAYQLEHPEEYLQQVGTIFTLTDGFKNLNKLIGKAVKKEKNNNIKNLEKLLKNQNNYSGSPRYVANGRKENESSDIDWSRYSL